MKTIIQKLKERVITLLISIVIVGIISLLVHPVSGLVTGIFGAPAIEGFARYHTLENGQFRKFDWWNVTVIWIGTIISVIIVFIGKNISL